MGRNPSSENDENVLSISIVVVVLVFSYTRATRQGIVQEVRGCVEVWNTVLSEGFVIQLRA